MYVKLVFVDYYIRISI